MEQMDCSAGICVGTNSGLLHHIQLVKINKVHYFQNVQEFTFVGRGVDHLNSSRSEPRM